MHVNALHIRYFKNWMNIVKYDKLICFKLSLSREFYLASTLYAHQNFSTRTEYKVAGCKLDLY
jgi:hypothetical protein